MKYNERINIQDFLYIDMWAVKYMILITIYRPQYVPVGELIDEFSKVLETFALLHDDFGSILGPRWRVQ